ncbi:hypothetical protein NX720_26150 [Endozoicomonas euniceicola]|uniref:Uncharacterized protein n=1 Tax=Endozoicomonas euniceicola TaxID=1234143 RepID=A0ABY6GTX9_9GAMM|nr:hypothetical protein [Endozoicomonas euniceicola]UYM16238.1 hypothetical protein NX720_26150 [Endozoicomonas euniceicola]
MNSTVGLLEWVRDAVFPILVFCKPDPIAKRDSASLDLKYEQPKGTYNDKISFPFPLLGMTG